MAGLAEVFTRLSNDPTFADLLRLDPVRALRGYELSVEDLQRLEAALGGSPPPITTLLRRNDTERGGS
jgi:hypothetical protein